MTEGSVCYNFNEVLTKIVAMVIFFPFKLKLISRLKSLCMLLTCSLFVSPDLYENLKSVLL